MVGSRISVELDDRRVLQVMEAIIRQGRNLRPAFEDAGEYLLLSHERRFDAGVAPEGTPWAPLSADYQARKPRNAHKIWCCTATSRISTTRLTTGTGAVHRLHLWRHTPVRPPRDRHPGPPHPRPHRRGRRRGPGHLPRPPGRAPRLTDRL